MKKQNIEIVIKGKSKDFVDIEALETFIEEVWEGFEIKLVRVEATNE